MGEHELSERFKDSLGGVITDGSPGSLSLPRCLSTLANKTQDSSKGEMERERDASV